LIFQIQVSISPTSNITRDSNPPSHLVIRSSLTYFSFSEVTPAIAAISRNPVTQISSNSTTTLPLYVLLKSDLSKSRETKIAIAQGDIFSTPLSSIACLPISSGKIRACIAV